jgi:hypothetical protein
VSRIVVPVTVAVITAGTAVILWILRPVDTTQVVLVLFSQVIVAAISVAPLTKGAEDGATEESDPPRPTGL